jgi:hypothetical protein
MIEINRQAVLDVGQAGPLLVLAQTRVAAAGV